MVILNVPVECVLHLAVAVITKPEASIMFLLDVVQLLRPHMFA